MADMTREIRCGEKLRQGVAKHLVSFALVAALLAASTDRASAVIAPSDTSRAPNSKMYMTWRAPFGQPRATDEIMAACGDSTLKDTLFVCLDPGQDFDQFQSFTASFYFWAGAGDTLDQHWNFGDGMNLHGLKVEFAPDDVPGTEPLWPTSAYAIAGWSSTHASGKLRMLAAGPVGHGWPLKGGTMYVAARVLVPHAQLKNKGCDGPVCIEWSLALLGLGEGMLPEIKSGERFVSWNSRGGKVCATMRSFAAPQPWRPKKPLPEGWKEH
jgi:hypothetical protein